MLAYSFSGKVSTLLAVIRAYSFIKFWEKILPTHLLEAYSHLSNFEKSPFFFISFFKFNLYGTLYFRKMQIQLLYLSSLIFYFYFLFIPLWHSSSLHLVDKVVIQPYSFIRNIHPCSFLETFTPTRLLDTYSPLLVYYISRKIPAYSLIRAYSFIRELRVLQNSENDRKKKFKKVAYIKEGSRMEHLLSRLILLTL